MRIQFRFHFSIIFFKCDDADCLQQTQTHACFNKTEKRKTNKNCKHFAGHFVINQTAMNEKVQRKEESFEFHPYGHKII